MRGVSISTSQDVGLRAFRTLARDTPATTRRGFVVVVLAGDVRSAPNRLWRLQVEQTTALVLKELHHRAPERGGYSDTTLRGTWA